MTKPRTTGAFTEGERVRIVATASRHAGRTGTVVRTKTEDGAHLLVVRMDDDASFTCWHWVRSLERLTEIEDPCPITPIRLTLIFTDLTRTDGIPGPVELIDLIAENHDTLEIAVVV